MALAPYWLSPTLWPFPVPVMVKEPPAERLNVPAPPGSDGHRACGGDGRGRLPPEGGLNAGAGEDRRPIQTGKRSGRVIDKETAAPAARSGR